jgi:hypothetical protein
MVMLKSARMIFLMVEVTQANDIAAVPQVGRELRQWMPIFVYAFPVTALAALLCTGGALAIEGAGLLTPGAGGAFGWAADAFYAPWVRGSGVWCCGGRGWVRDVDMSAPCPCTEYG